MMPKSPKQSMHQHQSFSDWDVSSEAIVRQFSPHVFRFFLEVEATGGAKVSTGAAATLLMNPGIFTLLVSIGVGPDLCGDKMSVGVAGDKRKSKTSNLHMQHQKQ